MRSQSQTSVTWQGAPEPAPLQLSLRDWVRIVRRGVPFGTTVFGGLAVLLLVRLVERPLFGLDRPVTPWITRGVCVSAFWWMGMERRVEGQPMQGLGAAVSNHVSWLDIFALNASDALYFVAKSEVAGWPAIGWLARATGTMFIRRDPRDAAHQSVLLRERLSHGHRLLFFPEGTSTDGLRVLPFKTTLFAPFLSADLKGDARVQPVSVRYTAPEGEDAAFYGWWGEMDFGSNLLKVLAAPRQGHVKVTYHAPIEIAAVRDRKELAQRCETQVRAGALA